MLELMWGDSEGLKKGTGLAWVIQKRNRPSWEVKKGTGYA